jgi:hypothetical protein
MRHSAEMSAHHTSTTGEEADQERTACSPVRKLKSSSQTLLRGEHCPLSISSDDIVKTLKGVLLVQEIGRYRSQRGGESGRGGRTAKWLKDAQMRPESDVQLIE